MAEKTKIKIPRSVKELRMSPKKFAKEHSIRISGKGLSKGDKKKAMKRLKKEYAANAIVGLDKGVKILAENPDKDGKKITKVREAVEAVLASPEFMRRIAKLYGKSSDQYPNMIYLPAMIMNTISYYRREDLSESEKEIAQELDVQGLMEFCERILKKQIKRYKSVGLSESAAFQLAVTIPTAKLLKNRFWYRRLIQQMYDIAASENVDPGMILQGILKVDKKREISKKALLNGFWSEFIMTKNSNKSKTYNDSQKDLHELLIEKALEYMDGLKHRHLRDFLKKYIKRRKTAESYKNDTKRVIKFVDHAHSNSAYTNIKATVQELIDENSANEIYLG